MTSELFIAIDDELTKDGAQFDEESPTFQLFTGKERRAAPAEEIEDIISDLRTAEQWTLMKGDWLLSGMLILVTAQAFRKPDVDHVADVIHRCIARSDIGIQDLVELALLVGEKRLADGAIDAGLITLIEGNLRSRRESVFYPEASALVLDSGLLIHRLDHSDIALITPPEDMRVFLGDRQSVHDGLGSERPKLGFRLVVIDITAIGLLVADTFVIVEVDVIWRI